jgi:hypothetical protein
MSVSLLLHPIVLNTNELTVELGVKDYLVPCFINNNLQHRLRWYQNPYLWLLITIGSVVLRRMASDSATDKASGLGTRKGNTSLRGSKDGILGIEDDERERVL